MRHRLDGWMAAKGTAATAVAVGALALLALDSSADAAGFGLGSGSVTARTCASSDVTCSPSTPLETQADAHPTGTTSFAFDTEPAPSAPGGTLPAGRVKDAVVQLPPGFVGDPQALPQCSDQELKSSTGCSRDAMVGYVVVTTGLSTLQTPGSPSGTLVTPVFNLVPAHAQTAQFGFIITEAVTHMVARVRTDGDYGLTITTADIVGDDIKEVTATFWGIPAEHNGPGPITVSGAGSTNSVGGAGAGARVPFLTNPSDCSSGALMTRLDVDSWEDPGTLLPDGEPDRKDPAWHTETASSPQPTGCESVPFDPSLTFQPVTHEIDTPSGYEVNISSPQNETVGGVGEADLDDVDVTLPTGVSVDPSAADGLQGCTDAQYGYGTNSPVSCPPASQIGEVEIETRLLAPHSLTGQVYLGTPLNDDPESGGMFRLFLVVHGPGLLIKIRGSAVASATNGQLSATFTNNPPLPFSEFKLRFNGGERAPLANPPWCETASTMSELSSYAGQTVFFYDPVSFSYSDEGVPCPASMPFSPFFSAGTVTPLGGAFSPLTLSFGRRDGQQALSQISTQLPDGLVGRLSSVPLCQEPQATTGTCGTASQIGTATAGVGAGSHPFYVSGPVYLTGPYDGAPFGISVAVPAIAGPYDLGTVVVRAGIFVNPVTAVVSVVSSPLPQILAGIQLRIQDVNVTVDRADFMLNPTSCTERAVTAQIRSTQGAEHAVSSPFGIAGCQNLPFRAELSASVSGKVTRASGASLDVKIVYPTGSEANLEKVRLQIPKALPVQDKTLNNACSDAQFGLNPAGCPAHSVIAQVTVHTPLLTAPLTGPAFLVSHGGAAFPDIELVLQSERVDLIVDGKTQIRHGVTYSAFETIPDAPITSVDFDSPRGAYALFTDHGNPCHQNLTMPVVLIGHNQAEIHQRTNISVTGCSSALSIVSARAERRTLVLAVYAPRAGEVHVSGAGVSSASKTFRGREVQTFTETRTKAGALRAVIHVAFVPSKGRRQSKTITTRFRA